MGIGLTIRELRIEKRLSQKELAIKLGVAPTTISGYEIDNSQPSIEKLITLSEIFNVSIDFLVSNPRHSKVVSEGTDNCRIEIEYQNRRIHDLESRIKDKDELITLLKSQLDR